MAIFTYGFNESRLLFENHGVQIACLTDYDTLIQCAVELGILKSENLNELLLWKNDPKSWRQ